MPSAHCFECTECWVHLSAQDLLCTECWVHSRPRAQRLSAGCASASCVVLVGGLACILGLTNSHNPSKASRCGEHRKIISRVKNIKFTKKKLESDRFWPSFFGHWLGSFKPKKEWKTVGHDRWPKALPQDPGGVFGQLAHVIGGLQVVSCHLSGDLERG